MVRLSMGSTTRYGCAVFAKLLPASVPRHGGKGKDKLGTNCPFTNFPQMPQPKALREKMAGYARRITNGNALP